ncbi:NirD/YgiW/YdeI family stress tolerance protein [Verticiella sediminum]|uniref:NirD/YgiW/YdeI family stress tolerance protein n=1 Tax=Verticiella sediminum TaxID=1247510 RepID=A0A556AB47_9BURK|nr:NirD/YgiW/YdeI family stress tolerance protein [Verticiella sediminum]TSH90109.1 NirD/YgiW/YdeI family stress tolerance protein [Verticiella sediminum]
MPVSSVSFFRLRSVLSTAALAAALAAGAAHAQYVGPADGSQAADVASILKDPVDDQRVRLEGHLLRKLGHEKYVFSDGTGEITAEIDDDDFPREPVDEKTRVQISGEVDTGRNRPPEIDVDSMRILR